MGPLPILLHMPLLQLLRAGLGGLLVGAGAAVGGGCTSGHGICGISRLAVNIHVTCLLLLICVAANSCQVTADLLSYESVLSMVLRYGLLGVYSNYRLA